ncbi:DNA polymerase eta [Coprinopsis marcescibilis]|uniref:DNA polymerase eta n=1 Tax=Coprinopsis marcescibilis TaxID=230819 RepID=A0A5C3L3M5_COPMA|nr:DNA polymerase eta [Coprinopsis marcescibilis]
METSLPDSPTKTGSLWKGKAKDVTSAQDEFGDLNPIITYRHLLSQNLGVRDPLRVVALCDSDAFYAACEMVRLGVDKDTPLVVLQWDSIIAVNYPARKYGISRMDKKMDALKRCPHLKIVHVATYREGETEPGYWDEVDTNTHKVSLDYYRRESLKIAAMFREMLPGCEVEKASIDEAFIDFTKPVREIILQRYPHLAQPPPDAPFGVETALPPPPPIVWDGKGAVIPVNSPPSEDSSITDGQISSSSDEPGRAEPLDKDVVSTWHDVALSIGAELMTNARDAVHTTLGYSTSAGIARNKFLAKLTASYRKPNGQSILRNASIPNYLRPMPFQKIRFLGGKLGRAFAEEYDAATVGDLLSITLDEMQTKFGESSIWVYEILRGLDRSEVKDKGSTLNKSMLASKNLPKPITNVQEGYRWIRVLAAELALRLNDARNMSPNLWPKTLVLHARKGYESSRSKQAPFPYTREVTVDIIAAAGDKLWKELVGTSTQMNVTNVQLSFTGIDFAEAGQKTIEGFFKPTSKRQRDSAELTDFNTQAEVGQPESSAGDAKEDSATDIIVSHTCTRCKKTLSLNLELSRFKDSEEQKTAIAALIMEHDDWHFAQDLVREEIPIRPIQPSASTSHKKTPKTKKRRKDPVGIERFFDRK